jgi:hypothetical protein
MSISFLKGIQRIEIVLIAILFLVSAFSQNFVYKLYSIFPEAVKWLMVNVYNLIVGDFFSNIGLDSEFWWGLGRGLSTALVIGLILWVINMVVRWIYLGFKK